MNPIAADCLCLWLANFSTLAIQGIAAAAVHAALSGAVGAVGGEGRLVSVASCCEVFAVARMLLCIDAVAALLVGIVAVAVVAEGGPLVFHIEPAFIQGM